MCPKSWQIFVLKTPKANQLPVCVEIVCLPFFIVKKKNIVEFW